MNGKLGARKTHLPRELRLLDIYPIGALLETLVTLILPENLSDDWFIVISTPVRGWEKK